MNDSLLPRAMLSPASPPPAPRPFLSSPNPTFPKRVRAENRSALNQGDWCNSFELGFSHTRATSDDKVDFFKHDIGCTCKRHDVMNGTFILPTNITQSRIHGKDEILSWFVNHPFPLQMVKFIFSRANFTPGIPTGALRWISAAIIYLRNWNLAK